MGCGPAMNQVLHNALANDAEFARGILRLTIRDSGLKQSAWASVNGFSMQYVSAVLKGRKKPSDRLCAAVGLRKVTSYIYDHDRAEAIG